MILGISPANALNTRRFDYRAKKSENVQKSDTFERSQDSENISRTNSSQLPVFKGFTCLAENFGLLKLYDIPCASCGDKTLVTAQINDFASKTRDKKGAELIEALESQKSYYKKNERKVVTQIIEHLEENPDDGLWESVQALNHKYLPELKKTQFAILERVNQATQEKLSARERNEIAQLVKKAKTEIEFQDGAYFKRGDFLNKIECLGYPADGESTKKISEIYRIAKSLPGSGSSAPAFYAKYAKRSSYEIARRLLLPSMATSEHVVPKSPVYQGENTTDNFIIMCRDCNSKRSSMPYADWLKIKPGMKSNFGVYIAEISKRIRTGELGEDYATYPSEVSRTVREQSSGEITAKPPAEIPSADKIKAAENKRSQAFARLKSLQNTWKRLRNDPEYKLIVEYYRLENSLKELFEEKKETTDELYGLKRNLLTSPDFEVRERLMRKKENYKRKLQDPKTKPDDKKRTQGLFNTTVTELEKADAINSAKKKEIAELEAKIAEIDKKIADLIIAQEQYLALVNEPGTIMKKEKELSQQPQTNDVVEWRKTLKRRLGIIQDKINAVRISEAIEAAQKEFDNADSCYKNLLASSAV